MTAHVVTVTPATTLPEARRLMTEKRIRRLPVVEDHKLVGIVSLSDVQEASPSTATSLSVWELTYLLSKLKVSEVMTADPITVAPEMTIGEAAQHMANRKIGGLPVVDALGNLVGIVTESDIFRLVAREWGQGL